VLRGSGLSVVGPNGEPVSHNVCTYKVALGVIGCVVCFRDVVALFPVPGDEAFDGDVKESATLCPVVGKFIGQFRSAGDAAGQVDAVRRDV